MNNDIPNNKKEKEEILSLSKDLGEIALDSLLDDGLFKDIPFISTGLSVPKLVRSLSDRILLSKIIHFINELQLKSQEEIDQFKQKYFKVKDYSTVGSKILLILERIDNGVKIKWLAKTLNLFIDDEIDKGQFLRLSSIINSGYVRDIEQIKVFKEHDFIYSHNGIIEDYILDHLYSVGLLGTHGFSGGDAMGNNSGTIYMLNSFGKTFLERIV